MPWGHGSSEILGTATGGGVWALVESGVPVLAGHHVKVIWRVTGHGPLMLIAVNARGIQIQPEELAAHDGSNWHRRGKEWGSSWLFPQAGCWDVHAERGSVSGDIWLAVS